MKKLCILLITLIFTTGPCLASEKTVPILLYHNVSSVYNMFDDMLHVTPDGFDNQLSALKNAGYNIISFQDYIKHVRGEIALPDNPVIITFDDGYSSVYYHAYPLLLKHQVPATVFVISGLLGFNDTLYPHFTWQQAREMDSSGYIDIQSHSNFHYDSTKISHQRLILELRKSKFDIETRLNKTCNILAFPYGEYDELGLMIAKQAGFEAVARTRDKGTNRPSDGLYTLNRIFVRGSWSGETLIEIIESNNLL